MPEWTAPIPARPLRIASRSLDALWRRLFLARQAATYWLHVESFYRARSDDVFVCGYPKSGSTLLRMLLYQITTDGEMTRSHFDDLSPYWEFCIVEDPARLATIPSPRVFKSHRRHSKLPRAAKKIHIVRHLADVAVSAFHHFRIMKLSTDPMEQHLDAFVDGTPAWGSWYRDVASWWPYRSARDVLMLRYEEVIRDIAGTALRVARFCGIDLDRTCLPRVVERCSFAFMKQHTAWFHPRSKVSQRPEPLTNGDFINKGQSGNGLSHMSEPQRRRMAARLAALARRLGVDEDDPWADLFRVPGYSVG